MSESRFSATNHRDCHFCEEPESRLSSEKVTVAQPRRRNLKPAFTHDNEASLCKCCHLQEARILYYRDRDNSKTTKYQYKVAQHWPGQAPAGRRPPRAAARHAAAAFRGFKLGNFKNCTNGKWLRHGTTTSTSSIAC